MTFDYAQATLGALAEESGRTVDKIYMIGDNPHTDIKGANEAKAGGAPWESVLVKTGIFQDAAGTGNHPQHPASLVWCVFLRPTGTSLRMLLSRFCRWQTGQCLGVCVCAATMFWRRCKRSYQSRSIATRASMRSRRSAPHALLPPLRATPCPAIHPAATGCRE